MMRFTVKETEMEAILFVLSGLFVLFVVDMVLKRMAWGKSTRYFSIHALANFGITIWALKGLIVTIKDPVYSLFVREEGAAYEKGLLMAVIIHSYHILAFQPIPFVDWAHHILMIGIIIPMVFMFVVGPLIAFGLFFTTGLPGGIDYVLLAMVKKKILKASTEKRINAQINVWVRAPGTVVTGALVYLACVYSAHCPTIAAISAAALYYWNAQYFLYRVVASHAKTELKLEAKIISEEESRCGC